MISYLAKESRLRPPSQFLIRPKESGLNFLRRLRRPRGGARPLYHVFTVISLRARGRRQKSCSAMADIEELIDRVITGQHPKFRERCIVDRIVSVIEDTFGAYDAAGVRAVLALCGAP